MVQTLGMKIKELRIKKGMTQTDLAEGLVTPSMISQIEADKANPSYKLLEALAKRLEVPIEFFLNDIQEKLELDSRYKLAKAMIQSGDYEKAAEILQELLQTPGMQTLEIKFDLVDTLIKNGDYDKALEFLEALYVEVSLDKDRSLIVRVLDSMGQVKMMQKDFILARHFLSQAYRETHRLEGSDRVLTGKVLRKLADVVAYLGTYEEAIRYYEDALNALQGTTELYEIGQAYEGLGDIYGKLGENRKAADYLRSAITLFRSGHKLADTFRCKTKLGLALSRMKDYEEAERIFQEVLADYQRHGCREDCGYVHMRMGEMYASKGEYEKALEYCQKGLQMIPEGSRYRATAQAILGETAWRTRSSEVAVASLQAAAEQWEQEQQYSELMHVQKQLSRIYMELGDLEAANASMEKATLALEKSLRAKGFYL